MGAADIPAPRRGEPPGAMFGFKKKDPAARLRREYERLMAEAVELQRRGDIKGFAAKTQEASEVEQRIAALEAEGSS